MEHRPAAYGNKTPRPQAAEHPKPLDRADCGAKLTHRSSLVQGKYLDDAFVCSSYRQLTRDCTMHYIPTAKMEAAILAAIQRVSWYVRHNEAEFIERVRKATDQHQENAVKEYRQKVSKAQRRYKELDGLVKKLYEGNATGKIPDKHFTRLLAEYDEEQTGLEAAIAQWQEAIESWNADRLKTDKFIELVSRYTDFSELTTPMLNEFIEKVVVHKGEGRGNSRRQRIDIYLNFIGAFEVPAHIVTPMEAEEQRRQQEEQAAKEARSQELAKAREEKRKAEKREFTARKKAGLLTPEEQAQKTQEDKIEQLSPQDPKMYLTTYYVEVPVGTTLDKLSYVKDIQDDTESTSDLFKRIQITGDVNTAAPGTYELTYYVVDNSGNSSNGAVLTIVVK